MSTMRLRLVTPERTIVNEEVEEVLAVGIEGEFGVLPQHMPMVTPLPIGELQLKKDGEWQLIAVGGGFIQVLSGEITVVADVAERSEDIDRERAEEARHRAETVLSEAAAGEIQAEAQAELQRALLRLRVSQRRHEGRSQHRSLSDPQP
ncbi:MAG TPA: F0F1 ATP synthase subunit epsilon [Chloroflexota bacterium]|jgi:F-type H+-transporting ATPase subunit epsilon|nr:F0F1 ATP synthase subunit epsilon [Chloroflexota bacterium]